MKVRDFKVDIRGVVRAADKQHSCARKRRHVDKSAAVKAIKKMGDKGKLGLSPYHCGYCDGWHIGHNRQLPHISAGGKSSG